MRNSRNTEKLYKDVLEVVQRGDYALRSHTISHMLSEGFNEENILEAIANGKILENYDDEDRCLIVGKFRLSEDIQESLHIVVDYWSQHEQIDWVDVVTAYIPHYPFWKTPYRRGKI